MNSFLSRLTETIYIKLYFRADPNDEDTEFDAFECYDEFESPEETEYKNDETFEIIELPFLEDEGNCIDTLKISDSDETKWRVFCTQIFEADELAKKLNELIRNGKLPKDRIFYKFLYDTVQFFYDENHSYHPDVVEFFSTIMFLGGRSTDNFVRGPMFYGQGKGFSNSRNMKDVKMNLGGPSLKVCEKQGSAFTTDSGVLKSLSGIHMKLTNSGSALNDAVTPLLDTDKVVVYPCSYSNDGTALKPAIEYDAVSKTNVGLTVRADHNFVKNNNPPDPEKLKDLIVTEAVVGSLTTLDNKVSLPVLVEYCPKAGKTGTNLTEKVKDHVKILQMCENCLAKTKVENLIVQNSAICKSFCETCFDEKHVCQPCKADGQVSIYPPLRACKNCLDNNEKCSKRAVLVITTDCEEGNKQMFLKLKDEIENGTFDPHICLAVPLPDAPHLGKSLKASFSNWFLQLSNERGCLAFLHTLRNRSTKSEREEMRKLLPKNDHVRNKDRQDPVAVLCLSKQKVIKHLESIGYVVHTIIPERTKFTINNKIGMYPCPISVCVGPHGYLFMLTYDQEKRQGKIYKVQLHNPVDRITVVKAELKDVTSISYSDEKLFYWGNATPLSFIDFSKKDPAKMKSKAQLSSYLELIGLELNVEKLKITEIQRKISARVSGKQKEYKTKKFSTTQLNFEDSNPCFEAIFISNGDIYGAESLSRKFLKIISKFDG